MIVTTLIHKFYEYSQTTDYSHGVMVEITGIVIEVVSLSIVIPIIFYIVQRIRTRHIRATADLYMFQIFHKITRMFLNMVAVDDIMPLLIEEKIINPNFKISSHRLYGNLANILFALRKIFEDKGSVKKKLGKITLSDFSKYAITADKCVEETERLTAMLSSLPKVQVTLFRLRGILFPLRDCIQEIIKDIHNGEKVDTYDLMEYIKQLTACLNTIFLKRKKLVDSMFNHQLFLSTFCFCFIVPFTALRRKITFLICRLKKKPKK